MCPNIVGISGGNFVVFIEKNSNRGYLGFETSLKKRKKQWVYRPQIFFKVSQHIYLSLVLQVQTETDITQRDLILFQIKQYICLDMMSHY